MTEKWDAAGRAHGVVMRVNSFAPLIQGKPTCRYRQQNHMLNILLSSIFLSGFLHTAHRICDLATFTIRDLLVVFSLVVEPDFARSGRTPKLF